MKNYKRIGWSRSQASVRNPGLGHYNLARQYVQTCGCISGKRLGEDKFLCMFNRWKKDPWLLRAMVTIATANFPDSDCSEDEDFELPEFNGKEKETDLLARADEKPKESDRKRQRRTEDLWKEMQEEELQSAKRWVKRPHDELLPGSKRHLASAYTASESCMYEWILRFVCFWTLKTWRAKVP